MPVRKEPMKQRNRDTSDGCWASLRVADDSLLSPFAAPLGGPCADLPTGGDVQRSHLSRGHGLVVMDESNTSKQLGVCSRNMQQQLPGSFHEVQPVGLG